MADLSPSQLDELEDGLDSLDATTDVASLGLSEEVADHMEAYRGVLDLVGSHLDEEEPSKGLLDDVLAKAHAEVAAAPRVTPATASGAGRRRWWMPVLALAGASAAVLWIVEPEQAMEGAAPAEVASAPVAPTDLPSTNELEEALTRASAATPPAEVVGETEPKVGGLQGGGLTAANGASAQRAQGGLAGLDLDEVSDPAPAPTSNTTPASNSDGYKNSEASDTQVPAGGPRPKRKSRKANAPAKMNTLEDLATQKSPFSDTSDPKRDWGDALFKAHKLRRGGRCGAALREYQTLARHKEVGDALLGEVYGGMGLCAEASGELSKAKLYFDKGRALKPGLEAWLTTERGRMSSK
jgi:hypothetical protein